MTARKAGLLRRLGAMLYDGLLVLALLFLATLPFVAVRGGEPVEPGHNLVYQLTMLFVIYALFVFFWVRGGQTLGTRSWRMQVETAEGKPPSIGRASVRFFVAIASLLPLGLGFIWQLWDRDNLTWHDRASGTRLMYYPK